MSWRHSGTSVERTCPDPFDGGRGVLAHAWYPEYGRLHFDESEYWTHNTDSGINLFLGSRARDWTCYRPGTFEQRGRHIVPLLPGLQSQPEALS